MRPNGTQAKVGESGGGGQGLKRVTSMARWLSRKRATPEQAPRVSVVMPVYNAESTLAECLTRVYQSTFHDFEFVMVDDGSTDRSRAIAQNFPVRIVSTPGRVGPAVARNQGAREATGDIIFFIDSDVMLRPDTLQTLVDGFESGEIDGFNGVQAADMRHRDVVSQYKNIWMRWTYLRQEGDVPLFYTTAAAIKREAFLESGGFDHGYATPNVEDTAYGQKLARMGLRIRIHPGLEVEHVKRYSLWGLLRTDFMRAVSLTRLKLRHPGELGSNNTSVPLGYVASIPLTGVSLLAICLGITLGWPFVTALGAAAAAGTVVLNREFLGAIRQSDGWFHALAAIPLLWAELLVAGVGSAIGLVTFPFGRRY
jgi:GT2 family glycosyltransferase